VYLSVQCCCCLSLLLLHEHCDLGSLGSLAKAQWAPGITELLFVNIFKHHIVCIVPHAFQSVTILHSQARRIPIPLLQEYCDLITLGIVNAK
jgi:hypothetical protein